MVQAALAALILIGLVPLAAAVTAGSAGLVVLLILAPLAPMAAVTLAYREWADPAGEISLATPSAGLKLVALRALVVSLAAAPVHLPRAPGRGPPGPGTCRSGWRAAWCLPGLALAALVLLAGTTRLDPFLVAIGDQCCLGRLGAGRGHRRPQAAPRAVPRPHRQPLPCRAAALAVLVAAALLTVVRRDAVTYRRFA